MDNIQQLMDQQAHAYICSELGHSRGFVLPVQKQDETRKVLTMCRICHGEAWIQLPPEGYERFLKDLADGKIKKIGKGHDFLARKRV